MASSFADPALEGERLRGGGIALTAFLFTLCFVMAQADKQVMGLLAIPIQDQFALTNTQLGLLQGGAFAIAYAIGGVPIGRLLDGGNRIRITAACVALWSLATLGSGLAGSFTILVLCRAATAFAEAGLPPAAFSIFAQSGDRQAATRLTSAFMLAPFVGGGLVLVLGGALLHVLGNGGAAGAHAQPWRIALLVVGAPGLLLALLLLLFGRDPPRAVAAAGVRIATTAKVLKTIFVTSRFLRFYYVAMMCFYALVSALIAWYPAFLARDLGASTAAAGAYAGLTYLVAGVSGTLCVNLLARLRKTADVGSMVRDFLIAALLLCPVVIAIPLMPRLASSVALYGIYAFLSAAIISSMPVPIQLSLPQDMRARGTAIASLVMSGLAGTIGPFAVGALIDRAGFSLAAALALVGGAAGTGAILFFALSLRALRTPSGANRPK